MIRAFVAKQAHRPSCGRIRNKGCVVPSDSGPGLLLGPPRPASSLAQTLLSPGREHVPKMVTFSVRPDKLRCGGPRLCLPRAFGIPLKVNQLVSSSELWPPDVSSRSSSSHFETPVLAETLEIV